MADYYTILTRTGNDKVVAALSGGPAIQLTRIAVGDGGGPGFYAQYDREALRGRNSLVNQHWIDDLNLVDIDPNNPAWVVTEGLIPTHVGGWYIREVGIFDADGDLIAIGVYPETYKPVATAVEADLLVRSIIEVGDADSVELRIDPSQVMATRAWVLDIAIPQALTMLDEAVERAEVARDIAQLAVGIYADESEGLAETSEGDYFWVAITGGDDLVMLYRHGESDTAEPQGTYPSGAALALLRNRLSSVARAGARHARQQREFHGNNPDSPAYAMTDEEGNELIIVERSGRVRTNPGPPMREFHTGRRAGTALATFTDEDGYIVCEFDERGQVMPRWITDFHGNGLPDWGYMTADGWLLYGGYDDGRAFYQGAENGNGGPGIDIRDLATSPQQIEVGEVWDDYGKIGMPRPYNPALVGTPASIFPNHTHAYAMLDQMRAEFPDYISSSVLGHNTLSHEIRKYVFANRAYNHSSGEYRGSRPTIVLLGNIHGSERDSGISNFQFIWNLVYGWRRSRIMGWLRWNCDIVFVPFVNPDGFDRNRRTNPNGVDLNRNFPSSWNPAATNAGPEAASELETRAVMNLPEQHPGAVFVGHHNFSNTSTQRILWIGSPHEEGFRIAETVADDVNYFCRREYEGFSQDMEYNRGLFRLSGVVAGGMDRHFFEAHGCMSFLFETRMGTWDMPRNNRQQLATHALEFLFKRICEHHKGFSIT